MRKLKREVFAIFLLASATGSILIASTLCPFVSAHAQTSTPVSGLDFGAFEALPDKERIPAAHEYLLSHFPVGSDLTKLLDALKDAGAKCDQIDGAEGQFRCEVVLSHVLGFDSKWAIIVKSKNQTPATIISIDVGYGVIGL